MVKVVKFGGSSLASAEQFTKVGDIIEAMSQENMLCRVHREREIPKTQR